MEKVLRLAVGLLGWGLMAVVAVVFVGPNMSDDAAYLVNLTLGGIGGLWTFACLLGAIPLGRKGG